MLYRFLCVSILAGIAGCNSQPTGDIVKTAPASGTLTFRGEALEYYRVGLFPTDNRPAMGVTNAEGKFVLGTNKPDDGAVIGEHKVAITYVGPPSTNPEEGMTVFTPPPPPKHKIPAKYGNPETSNLKVDIPKSGNKEIKLDLQ